MMNKTPTARPRSGCSSRCSNSSSTSILGFSHQQAALINNITPSRNQNYTRGKVACGDRYVAVRSEEQLELAAHLLSIGGGSRVEKENENSRHSRSNHWEHNTSASAPTSPASRAEREAKKSMMRVKSDGMLCELGGKGAAVGGVGEGDRVCAYRKGLAPLAALGHRQPVNVLYSLKPSSSVKRSRRYIAKSPERILDAPGIRDDYYSTLSDWSKNNVVAVALDRSIYLWNAASGDVDVLATFDERDEQPFPTLVKWSQEGRFLAVGLSDGCMKIYDVVKRVCSRSLSVQMHRMACGCWCKGIITYGTRSGRIYHHDVRVAQSLVGMFDSHTAEVCGLKWSEDEQYLTSGGADSIVNVWEHSQVSADEPQPIYTFNDHIASVKAVEYVPFPIGGVANMVATGGGTNDQTVRLWNLSTGQPHSVHNTQSQVTGILFNRPYKEMVVGNGNPNSGVRIWRYEPASSKLLLQHGGGGEGASSSSGGGNSCFEHVADLKSHGGRVLGLCQSPCREYVMSTGEDETMRLWHCWKVDASSMGQLNGMKGSGVVKGGGEHYSSVSKMGFSSSTAMGSSRRRLELGVGNVIR